jgi:hypothetical protein
VVASASTAASGVVYRRAPAAAVIGCCVLVTLRDLRLGQPPRTGATCADRPDLQHIIAGRFQQRRSITLYLSEPYRPVLWFEDDRRPVV